MYLNSDDCSLVNILAHELYHLYYVTVMGRAVDVFTPSNINQLYKLPDDLTIEHHYETMASIIQFIAYMFYMQECNPDIVYDTIYSLDELIDYANTFCGMSIDK